MSERRTLRGIYHELVSHPFFPLLFIGKFVETGTFYFVGSATLEEVAIMGVLAVVSTVLWALSDAVDVEFDKENFVGK